MDTDQSVAGDGPSPESLLPAFRTTDVERRDDGSIVYYGRPQMDSDSLERHVWPQFRDHGYEVRFDVVVDSTPDPITGVEVGQRRQALVAEPRRVGVDGVPWTNVVMFVATVLTTLYAGTIWYYQPVGGPLDLLAGWPFAAAVLGVLAVHELGHYALSRYHDVQASLPYFIPVPTFIGTFGAVISMKGRIPDREALFDIGVSGPLAGLVAAVAVAVVGLHLDPVEVPQRVLEAEEAVEIELGYPPLLEFLAWATGQQLTYEDPTVVANPVIFGAWVGLFVTFLNLIPVGQLDGGHVVRSMFGERAESVAAVVPVGLFGLAAYLFISGTSSNASVLWAFWGLIALVLSYVGHAEPVFDEPLGTPRMAVGAITFVLGVLCFTPVPIELVGA
ncbi:M50 family metalloprotease [Natronomonas pharaonis DSM 2160]|uniref:M50 family metalloprotease n=1 Tax=Natronomonas pharaonis (strain ATCC 35678 / DSM 2160 / CIP 103997 / JCM 8858 / NBRC 14720 / NCIMB 2260 / Gabara) TaxID=348780 RepID=A0A1U7EVZ2_NATPD|nr:site-2 protease family protein [Natronomonas pharaonis]CAI49230.1 M50 family metalloprotease [Natronomonas pharaonis DSM 2160]